MMQLIQFDRCVFSKKGYTFDKIFSSFENQSCLQIYDRWIVNFCKKKGAQSFFYIFLHFMRLRDRKYIVILLLSMSFEKMKYIYFLVIDETKWIPYSKYLENSAFANLSKIQYTNFRELLKKYKDLI